MDAFESVVQEQDLEGEKKHYQKSARPKLLVRCPLPVKDPYMVAQDHPMQFGTCLSVSPSNEYPENQLPSPARSQALAALTRRKYSRSLVKTNSEPNMVRNRSDPWTKNHENLYIKE
jgi:hypothetical protein